MTQHDRFTELIPAYAVNATDADETREVEEHLRACAQCRWLAGEYRQLGDDLLFTAPLAAAPVGLSEDLRKKLDVSPAAAPKRTDWLGWLRKPSFALGAVALALLLLTNVYWVGRVGSLERRAEEFVALTQANGITLQVADAQLHADGVIYVQPNSNVALLCVYSLPELEPGKTYQAWLIQNGERVSAGTFEVNQDGYGALLIDAGRPVSEFQQLGITVEPAGGSPAPTSPRIMGGNL
jgi:anti-sigma-K factor RskA